jgi:predicted MFS family arabinose efflux permease
MIVPQLVGALGWRASYWTGLVLALAGALPVLAARRSRSGGHAHDPESLRRSVFRDPSLWPPAVVQIATFGLAVVAGNWVVTLLERDGHGRSVSGVVGGLVLFAGVVARPAGGLAVRGLRERTWTFVAAALCIGSIAILVLASSPPLWLAALAALAAGLAAGFPFASVFDLTLRLRPDAPAAAVGLVNGSAVLVILVGTPLAGLAFSLPGDGRIAFVAIGLAWAAALVAVPAARRSAIRV